jgi:hypothetical protein
MRQILSFLLLTMAFPSVQAFCDNKPCDTPFLCYERELCRFKENAKASIKLTMKQLTRTEVVRKSGQAVVQIR